MPIFNWFSFSFQSFEDLKFSVIADIWILNLIIKKRKKNISDLQKNVKTYPITVPLCFQFMDNSKLHCSVPSPLSNLARLKWYLMAVCQTTPLKHCQIDQSDLRRILFCSHSFPIQQKFSQFIKKEVCAMEKSWNLVLYTYVSCEYIADLLLLLDRLRSFLPFLDFLSVFFLLSFLFFVSLLCWLSHKQLSGKHFLSSSSRGQAAPLLAGCIMT